MNLLVVFDEMGIEYMHHIVVITLTVETRVNAK